MNLRITNNSEMLKQMKNCMYIFFRRRSSHITVSCGMEARGWCNPTCFTGILWIIWFDILTTVSTKMGVFWVTAPCSLHHQGDSFALMMEAVITSETLVNFDQCRRLCNTEDRHLYSVDCLQLVQPKVWWKVTLWRKQGVSVESQQIGTRPHCSSVSSNYPLFRRQ
jgi:hypothetical protein